MSFNSSVQQLGTGASSVVAGLIVAEGAGGRILRYSWLGYLSIVVLLFCAWLGNAVFRFRENGPEPNDVTNTPSNMVVD